MSDLLIDNLRDLPVTMNEWGEYASDYFQNKHGLREDVGEAIATVETAIAEIKRLKAENKRLRDEIWRLLAF